MKTSDRPQTMSFLLFAMGVLFCTCLIASNLLETKVMQIGKYTLTGGLLCFPISYILSDCITEVWGYRKTRFIIWMGFLMNLLVVLFGLLAVWIPAADCWVENEPHFNFVFGFAPRIAVASFAAFLIGSFVNAYVMSRMKIRDKGRRFWWRAMVSTLWGEGFDSIVFFPLAFGGLMPVRELLKLMLLQVCTKTLYELLILPLTVHVVKYVKKHEDTDVFDVNVSYNPLNIKDC